MMTTWLQFTFFSARLAATVTINKRHIKLFETDSSTTVKLLELFYPHDAYS